MNRLRMEQRAGLSGAKRELERVKREIQKVIDAIVEPALKACNTDALDEAVTAGKGRVETLELGHRYGHLSPLVAVA